MVLFHFLVTNLTFTFREKVTPPLSKKNFSKLLVLPNLVIKLIKCHLPTFVKNVMAPKNDFGIPKITWDIYKSLGN